MELLEIGERTGNGTAEIIGRIRGEKGTFEIYFRFPDRFREFLLPAPEPFLCALLVPAMSLGVPLRTSLPVSPTLLRGFRRAQVALQVMYPDLLRVVPVEAQTRPLPQSPEPRRMGSFFSCGVDSFYTALSNLQDPKPGYPPLTHALFMRGLETELAEEEGVDQSAAVARQATTALGLDLIEGETNLRSFFSVEWLSWSGTGLAATAHALGRGFEVFLIPASGRYFHHAPPIGSHPIIDESCSTELVRIHNDGAHVGRPFKVASRVASSDVALTYLRVCRVNRGGAYNCGRCPKCLRTMIMLEAAGVLDRVRTLPRLPSDWRSRYNPVNPVTARETLLIARERGRPESVVRALEKGWRRARIRNAVRELFEASSLRHLLPAIRRVRAAARPTRQSS